MLVLIKSVSIENVPGRGRGKGYSNAVVIYDLRGEEKKWTIRSFSNPEVFKRVQEYVGQTVEVTTGKNDAGYDEWKSVAPVGANNTTNVASPGVSGTTRVSGSNYETKEERAARQVLIVKQSSLSSAVETLSPGAKAALDPNAVIELAQKYTDWVFATEYNDEKGGLDVFNS
jgi:hypothetical protein